MIYVWKLYVLNFFPLPFNVLGREASCQATSLASGPEDQEERDDAGPEEHSDGEAVVDGGDAAADFSNLKGRQKKLFELKMKMVCIDRRQSIMWMSNIFLVHINTDRIDIAIVVNSSC